VIGVVLVGICVAVIVAGVVAARVEQHENRLRRLEEQARPGFAHEFQAAVAGSAHDAC
jgi:hypothetical protein